MARLPQQGGLLLQRRRILSNNHKKERPAKIVLAGLSFIILIQISIGKGAILCAGLIKQFAE